VPSRPSDSPLTETANPRASLTLTSKLKNKLARLSKSLHLNSTAEPSELTTPTPTAPELVAEVVSEAAEAPSEEAEAAPEVVSEVVSEVNPASEVNPTSEVNPEVATPVVAEVDSAPEVDPTPEVATEAVTTKESTAEEETDNNPSRLDLIRQGSRE